VSIYRGNSRFQESISVAVYDGDGRQIRDADMVRLDPHELPILLVRIVHTLISFALAALQQQPEIRELGCEGPGDVPYPCVGSEVRDEEVERERDRDRVGRDQELEDSHGEARGKLLRSRKIEEVLTQFRAGRSRVGPSPGDRHLAI
jgi:hypothetical protein